MKITIPYGNGTIGFSLADERVLGILQNKSAPKNIKKAVLKSLRNIEVPFRKKRVLIAVPDATRSAHLKDILPSLIDKISLPSRSIDIIVATGLHKPHTPEQLRKLLGAAIVKRHKILRHDPSQAGCVGLGETRYGVPAALSGSIFDHDFLISVGVVEPHLYAGYSGGAKTIAIGLAGKPTIDATHSIRFLDDPATNIGSIKGNKFQETLWHILEKIPPVFSVNTVNDQDGKALKIFCGPAKDVFARSVDFAVRVFSLEVKEQADIAICGIGYPKDINIYQASRAMNYILSVDRPVVKKGGVLIIAAELKDGIGEGPGEKRFYEELKNMAAPVDFVNNIRREGCVAGQHRAFMVARALIDYNVLFVTAPAKDFMKGLPIGFCRDMEEAIGRAEAITGKDSKIYVIPRALATIARERN